MNVDLFQLTVWIQACTTVRMLRTQQCPSWTVLWIDLGLEDENFDFNQNKPLGYLGRIRTSFFGQFGREKTDVLSVVFDVNDVSASFSDHSDANDVFGRRFRTLTTFFGVVSVSFADDSDVVLTLTGLKIGRFERFDSY